MRTQRFSSRGALQIPSIDNIFFMVALIVPQLLACNTNQTKYMTKTDSITANPGTFQELGFFGDIKKDKWNDFVQAVQNNITLSRKEQGNLSFSLYQPEDGKLQPIWFERFESENAHNYHKEQRYFKDAITAIQKSLAGEASAITLKVLHELPATIPIIADQPEQSRHVIVLFNVKPEKRQSFINAMAEAVPASRQAQENLEFNLYSYADDLNKFVLVEGWKSRAGYEAQLKQEHSKRLNAALEGLFMSNPMGARWVVKDISQ
jgi:quinol monooxygenase YgiN